MFFERLFMVLVKNEELRRDEIEALKK